MENLIPKLRFPEFKGEWEKKKLLDLSENGFSNGAFNDPKKVGSGYRIINVKDMYVDGTINVNNLTRVALEENEFFKNRVIYGDIFFTRSSLVKEGIAYSNVNLTNEEDLTYDGHLIRMRPNKKYSTPVFLYYNFGTSNVREQLIIRGKTTTMTTIGQEDIATVEISFPTLPEQQKIATFLTSVDEKLQALKQKKSLLEQYKKGFMQKIFSQELRFKPARPSGGDENGNDFPDWEEKSLGEVCEIVGGGTPDTNIDEYWNGNIQWFTPTEIKTSFVSKSIRTISELGLKKSSAKLIPKGSILLTTRATIGEASIATEECTTNQGFQSLIVIEGNYNLYIYNWIKVNRAELMKRANGSTFPEISKSEIETIPILTPSLKEQIIIGNFLTSIDDKINHCGEQIAQMEVWKKGVLQGMFC